MSIQKSQYEEVLAEYSNVSAAIALLKRYRPYLEMLPSIRRPHESLITIPMPVVRMRQSFLAGHSNTISTGSEIKRVPCDIAILMCDPEWKIKTGVEIFIFIHRPQEDFSDLLDRWRQTQVSLSKGYEWSMPLRYRHILSEGSDTMYPLFVLFEETPERVKRGLKGAFLPFVTQQVPKDNEPVSEETESRMAELDEIDVEDLSQ
jgi:hypothetical protein